MAQRRRTPWDPWTRASIPDMGIDVIHLPHGASLEVKPPCRTFHAGVANGPGNLHKVGIMIHHNGTIFNHLVEQCRSGQTPMTEPLTEQRQLNPSLAFIAECVMRTPPLHEDDDQIHFYRLFLQPRPQGFGIEISAFRSAANINAIKCLARIMATTIVFGGLKRAGPPFWLYKQLWTAVSPGGEREAYVFQPATDPERYPAQYSRSRQQREGGEPEFVTGTYEIFDKQDGTREVVLTPDKWGATVLSEVFDRMGTDELLKDGVVQTRYRIVRDGTSKNAGELG